MICLLASKSTADMSKVQTIYTAHSSGFKMYYVWH